MLPNNPEKSLPHSLDALARHAPEPAATEQALARTRNALLQLENAHKRRRWIMRIAIPTGIVAALILAAVLFFTLQSPRHASAAEDLNAVVEATTAYKGWIKLTTTFPEGLKAPVPNPPLPPSFGNYIHPDGSWTFASPVDPMHPDGKYTIYFWSVPRREIATYNADTNEIHLGTMQDLQHQAAIDYATPITITDLLAVHKKEFGRDALTVKESPEGDASRFDITLFSSPEEAKAFAKEHNIEFLGTGVTIWVNRDHLITRMRLEDPHGPVMLNYTYNVPELHDIYDIGAPRSAKVIDDRLTQNLQSVMDRVDARAAKGFGNYTAFLASYDLDADGKPSASFGYAYLFAVHDRQWLANQYRLFEVPRPGRKPTRGVVLQAPPAGWPNPDLAKLLPILQNATPTEYFVATTDHGSSGFFQTRTGNYQTQPLDSNVLPYSFAQKRLTTFIWPDRLSNEIGSPSVHSDLLQDKDHPGLVGIHFVRLEKVSEDTDGGNTWWFDPAKDDMPVEKDWSINDSKGNPTTISKTHYLQYAQLPNGQWYPTDWREDRSDLNPRTHKMSDGTSHYRLNLLPTLTLDNSWFQPPAPKFTSPQPAP